MDGLGLLSEPEPMELNTRELALLAWIAICVAGILLSKNIRPSALGVVRALFQTKIIDVLGLAALYTAACVWLLAELHFWEWRNLKTVIVWYLGTAFVAMADTKKLEQGPVTLFSIAKGALAMAALVQFISNVSTLPFWAEFLLVPFFALLGGLLAVAEHKAEHRIVIAPLNAILTVIGLYILGYSIYQVVIGWHKIDGAFQVREFAVPILLTLMFLPFLYGLMVYMGLERAAVRLLFTTEDRPLRRYIWLRGILAFGANVETFERFIHALQMSDGVDRKAVGRAVDTLRRARRREKSPPLVDWSEGWSPYAAREFLAEHGLRTNPYHPTVSDWWAESPYLKLDSELWPDRLIYRICGTETAATELVLRLNVDTPAPSGEGEARFWQMAIALVLEALGGETTERFAAALPTDEPLLMQAGDLTIGLEKDNWEAGTRGGYSRRLTIRHPAHKDPFSALE